LLGGWTQSWAVVVAGLVVLVAATSVAVFLPPRKS